MAGRAGHRPGARRRLPRRARGLPGHPRRAGRAAHPDAPPAGCPTGSSACTRWPGTRWPPAPASTRSATARSRRWGSGGPPGPCAPARGGRRVTRVAAIDCGTNSIRLLVADVPADGRAHRPAAPDGGRAARPGRRRHRPAGPGGDRAHPRGAGRVRRAGARPGRDRRSGWSPPAPPATPPTAPTSRTWCVATLGRLPDVVTGDEEAELSFLGATASLDAAAAAHGAAPPPAAVPRRRHRRRLDGVRARRRRRRAGGPLGRRRLRPADRAAPARRPADRRRRSAGAEDDIRAALAEVAAEVPVGEAATLVGARRVGDDGRRARPRPARLRRRRPSTAPASRSTTSAR